MRLSQVLATVVVGAGLVFSGAQAHSVRRNPLNYLTIVDDPVIHTPSHRVHAHTSFDLTFHLHGGKQLVKLTLTPNHDVLAEDATINYLGPDGKTKSVERIERSDHKVFRGQTLIKHREGGEWTNVGWARIVVHRDGVRPVFEGAFRVDGDHHHIHPRATYVSTKHLQDPMLEDDRDDVMVVWRDSDIGHDAYGGVLRRDIDESTCLSDDLTFNMMPEHPVYSAMLEKGQSSWGALSPRSLFSRQIDTSTRPGNGAGVNLANSIGSTIGCPTTRKVALVGIAADCTYMASFNSSETARSNIITQMNSASVLYEDTFNISLGIQNLTVLDANCPGSQQASAPWNVGCNSGLDIQARLNLFSAWRGLSQDTNAYWTLLTTCGTDTAVGLAWLGQACVNTAYQTTDSENKNETVSGANVVVKTNTEWLVLAHEVGHTFGAVHDCVDQTCNDGQTLASQQCCPLSSDSCPAGGRFVMNPFTAPGVTNFSPCSIGNICTAIGRNSVKTGCLTSNKNVPTISGSQCGNGIVEQGEDCDCGGVEGCGTNNCCDPTTCKFKGSAVCDPSNEECCTSTCGFATADTICRASTGVCDPQETCTGTSAVCPADANAPDGQACGNSTEGLTCASGQCSSRNLQCKTLMGVYTQNNSTYACSDSGCQILCASPEFGFNVCYRMNQYFLDGTSCQGGGKCSNGICQGSTVGGEISSWVNRNKPLVIGLAAGIGGLIVLAVLSCCVSSWRRRRRMRKTAPAPPPGWRPQGPTRGFSGGQEYAGIPHPPPMAQRNGGYGYGAGGQQYNNGWNAAPLPPYSRPAERYA